MLTATYTDAATGWEQRVKVAGDTIPDPDSHVWIGNPHGETAKVPADTLSGFHREQDANREYLPGWNPDND